MKQLIIHERIYLGMEIKENYQQTNNNNNNTFSNGDTTSTNHLTNLERLKGLGGLLVFRSMENNNKSIMI